MSQRGEAILEFTIKIDAKLAEASKQTVKDLQQSKMQKTGTLTEEEEKAGIVAKGKISQFEKDPFFKEPVEDEQLKKNVVEALNKLDNKALGNLATFAQNPTNATFTALSRILTAAGPEGQILLAVIVTALTLPEVLKIIVTALSQKGFPLNRDWHRYISKEVDVGLTRELQKRKELGIDKLVLAQFGNKFIQNNPHWTTDSYLNITPQRLARIGLTDRAAGVIVP